MTELYRRVAVIVAILNELNIPVLLGSTEDSIAMQKAIYLAQVSGVDLGYRFSWYVRGPYCQELASDYCAVIESPDKYTSLTAAQSLKGLLAKVKGVVEMKPQDTPLVDWLEATASLDFLYRVQKLSGDKLREMFVNRKPYLEHLYNRALGSIQLLNGLDSCV